MPLSPFQKANYAMMRLMVRVMPPCKDIAILISQSMDQRLPLTKRISIRLHVAMCSLCRRYEKQLRLLRESTGRYANPDENEVEESLSPEAKARLQKAIESEAK
jgi:hypothetical protein